jgi:hypothetical protein
MQKLYVFGQIGIWVDNGHWRTAARHKVCRPGTDGDTAAVAFTSCHSDQSDHIFLAEEVRDRLDKASSFCSLTVAGQFPKFTWS